MPKHTPFLSRLLGLYCLIMAVVMAADRASLLVTVTDLTRDRPLMFVVGICTLFAGLAMVLVHNVWSGGALAVVITLLGWLTLAKALFILLLAPATATDFYLYPLHASISFYVYTAILAVLGLYLTYAGFRSKAS